MQILRPYQIRALDGLRQELRAGRRRIVLVAPTGAGKTTIAAEMIRSAVLKGGSVLGIAHRVELITQLRERLSEHGVQSGIIMARNERIDQPVMVASIQTLVRRELPPATVIIVDECHHARATTYGKILDAYPAAAVIGLTASPWRLDGKGLADVFEASVVAASPAELLELGFLCPFYGYAYVAPDFGNVGTKAGDYDPAGLSLAYKQSTVLGDIVERWFQHANGQRTILFASSIDNSQEMIERFRDRGVRAEHIDYNTPAPLRRSMIERVRSGETTIISNVGLLGEGLDVPSLAVAILARPTKSLAVYLQQVGRILRPFPGKDRALILDHAGNMIRHGLPDQERDYSLTISKQKKPSPAPVRQCPSCLCICAAGTEYCPE